MGFRAAAVLQPRVDSFEKLEPGFLRRHYPGLAGIQDDAFDLTALRDRPMPLRDFSTIWSELTALGTAAPARVPAPLRTSLSYADLVREPYGELTRLAGFLGVEPDPEWLRAGAALLDGGREGAALRLPRRELAAPRVAGPGRCDAG
ncbi:hypothetical protein [Streptomyces oceani]|uniref:hypothetical protein n=1 Tax=Streptomyces oceani TaxID=1075402 RepID=UPI001FCE278A|nr:hypothetical protein [Streptomyces oceani]